MVLRVKAESQERIRASYHRDSSRERVRLGASLHSRGFFVGDEPLKLAGRSAGSCNTSTSERVRPACGQGRIERSAFHRRYVADSAATRAFGPRCQAIPIAIGALLVLATG